MNKKELICLDIETTGLDVGVDEILQLSIIDENYKELINSYFKPEHVVTWNEAQKVHKITPEMVKNKPSIQEVKKLIQGIINNAKIIIGYGISFDINFLKESLGIIISDEVKIIDVMEEFAPIYGQWNAYYQSYTWQKLSTCAGFFGYKFKAHDSLEDVKATLYSYYKIKEYDCIIKQL